MSLASELMGAGVADVLVDGADSEGALSVAEERVRFTRKDRAWNFSDEFGARAHIVMMDSRSR